MVSSSPHAGTRLLVVSPHLDDGVLSLGAFIATAVDGGARVSVVTIFGGDPDSTAKAGPWDGRGGFETAGEATRARREEDKLACETLGAECDWLPYLDKDYGPPPSEDDVWGYLSNAVERADFAFVPGRPLIHPDHAWVSRVVSQRTIEAKLVFYAELPYNAWPKSKRQGESTAKLAVTRSWTAPGAKLRARRLKWQASKAYATQLPWLARPGYRLGMFKSRFGSERLAWPRK